MGISRGYPDTPLWGVWDPPPGGPRGGQKWPILGGLRRGQNTPFLDPLGGGSRDPPPGGSRTPRDGARRAPGAEISPPRNHPFLSEKPTSVPTGRVIKYPRKCTPPGPGPPGGPPGGVPGPGGLGPPSRGVSQGGPGTPNLPSLGTPSRGGLGPPPGGVSRGVSYPPRLGVGPGGPEVLGDPRQWAPGGPEMACGQVRARQAVPTRELGPDWVGAIPTRGARGPPERGSRVSRGPRAGGHIRSIARRVALWYTDFQTPPLPLDFKKFCQKRDPVSTIFAQRRWVGKPITAAGEVPYLGWGSAA